MRLIAGIVFLAAVSPAASAQQPKAEKPQPRRGVVTGTVYCADTNTPARLAVITLLPAIGQQNGQMLALSDLDGRFAIGKLPEGTYYVSARYGGYLDPFPRAKARDLAGMSAEERKQLESQLIVVSVSAQQTATVAVRLERAAVVEGTVSYDDGSPAVGVHVTLRPKPVAKSGPDKKKPEDGMYSIMSAINDAFERTTDDRGHFRALGVAPGEYLVSTTLFTASGAAPENPLDAVKFSVAGALNVYYGDTTRASTAKTIKITGGEFMEGADITIPLSKLHTVRGLVTLKSTGQPPQMASLRILYADTRELARIAVAPDGEFELDYLPEGSYIVQASAVPDSASQLDPSNIGIVISSVFGSFISTADMDSMPQATDSSAAEFPLDVHGERTGITIEVPDPPTKKDTASAPASIPTPPAPPPQ